MSAKVRVNLAGRHEDIDVPADGKPLVIKLSEKAHLEIMEERKGGVRVVNVYNHTSVTLNATTQSWFPPARPVTVLDNLQVPNGRFVGITVNSTLVVRFPDLMPGAIGMSWLPDTNEKLGSKGTLIQL